MTRVILQGDALVANAMIRESLTFRLMKTPVELPSGQILDLSRCIFLRLAKDNEYELMMEGYQQSIQISTPDALRLKQLLIARKDIPVWSPAQQQERNEAAMQKLQEIIDRDKDKSYSTEAQSFFEEFQKIVDEQRPIGQKLFSE
jgi:hypothetical protein